MEWTAARAAAAEAASAAAARSEFVDDSERRLHDGQDHELRDSIEWSDRERLTTSIPATHH